MKTCPYCAEEIQEDAIICRYCGKDLAHQTNPMIVLLVLLRNLVGILQTITILGGCGALVTGSGVLLSAAIQWFIIFLAVQFVILFLIYIFSNLKNTFLVGFIVIGIITLGIYLAGTTGSSSNKAPPSPVLPPTKIVWPTPTVYKYTYKTPTRNPCTLATTIHGDLYTGKYLCVYGIVYENRTMSWGGSRIYFDSSKSFFFVSSDWYFEVSIGECVQAQGTVEVSAEGIPYINVKDTLYLCD